jgi:CDP-diglyceride synthetase
MYGIMMSAWSDTGGIMFGMVYGKTKFAHSISPNKTFEGVLGAILWPCTVISGIFYLIGHYSDGEYAI